MQVEKGLAEESQRHYKVQVHDCWPHDSGFEAESRQLVRYCGQEPSSCCLKKGVCCRGVDGPPLHMLQIVLPWQFPTLLVGRLFKRSKREICACPILVMLLQKGEISKVFIVIDIHKFFFTCSSWEAMIVPSGRMDFRLAFASISIRVMVVKEVKVASRKYWPWTRAHANGNLNFASFGFILSQFPESKFMSLHARAHLVAKIFLRSLPCLAVSNSR